MIRYFILLTLIFLINLNAVMASSIERTATQSDGTVFRGTVYGDEYFIWAKTVDDYVIKYNVNTHNYEYMLLSDDNLSLEYSGVLVNSRDVNDTNTTLQDVPSHIKRLTNQQLGKVWQEEYRKTMEKYSIPE